MENNSLNGKTYIWALLPVLFCFLSMGFVDFVGIASNYVKSDLQLTDSQANIFPSLVFFWFLIFSVPSSLLMNKIGRQKTVLVSIALSLVAMIVPLFGDSYWIMLFAFSFMGIGNAVMQTALNPLVRNVVAPDKLPSMLTLGQFIKSCLSASGPVLAAWGAQELMPTFGYGWRVVFLIYTVVGVISFIWLAATPITRESADKVSGFKECVVLLAKMLVFLSFLGIICHVGIDVGINTTAPRIFMERCNLTLADASYSTFVYFICRIIGSLTGAVALQKVPAKLFFFVSAALLVLGLGGWLFISSLTGLYICIIMLGLGNSNIFPIIVSQVILRMPKEANEVSGLMVMGLFGGTLFPLLMGVASDMTHSQGAAIFIMLIGAVYLLCYTKIMQSENVDN